MIKSIPELELEAQGVIPNFRRTEVRTCYHCIHFDYKIIGRDITDYLGCKKYNVWFCEGNEDSCELTGIEISAEFVCDSFEG